MKKNKKHKQNHNVVAENAAMLELDQPNNGFFLENKTLQIAILLIVSFAFYFNTIWNDYLLDDVIVITKNKFTLMGFSGIWDIFSKDTIEGYSSVKGLLSGGRYRPLSLVTFAAEIGLFGANHPAISHFINVLLYCAVVLMLFLFLDKFLLKKQPLLSFLSAFLFAIHPIHTEIVANIKSRDELMSLLFTLIALHLFFTYLQNQKEKKYLIISLVLFFLSLLSKENGLMYIVIIPLMLYYFHNYKFKDAILKTLPFLFIILFYLFIRTKITGIKLNSNNNDIMNAPYLFAHPAEAFATKMEVMGKYLLLLIFPHPQSYDYSYAQIAYIKLSNIKFLISLAVNVSLIVYAFKKFKEKNIYSFSIFFYFLSIALVSNFLFDVGAPMGDRFLFQPSIAFSIAISAMLCYFIEKINWQTILVRKIITGVFISAIFILSGFKTINRNSEWKNEDILYIVDIEASPNSAHANLNAAVSASSISTKATNPTEKKIWFDKAIGYYTKAIQINPRFVDAFVNMGATYFLSNDLENAAMAWDKARALNPANPPANYFEALSSSFCTEGVKLYDKKNIEKAAEYYKQAIKYNPNNADAYYYLGGTFLMKGDKEKARELWTKALEINPNHTNAKAWLTEISKSQ